MIYVTVRITEPYKQIALEDIMLALFQGENVRERTPRSPYTRTFTYERLPERILAGFDVEKKIGLLRTFNKKHHGLMESDIREHYHKFFIPKKSGGMREINAPDDELMNCLRELKLLLESEFYASSHAAAYAYVKNRSSVDAAKVHQWNKSKWYLKTDISGFFPNTTPEFVWNALSMIYPFCLIMECKSGREELRKALSLCFLDGGLPMGTPISPMLTNLIMIPFDFEFSKFLRSLQNPENNPDEKGRRFAYTRYADDMNISCGIEFDKSFIIRKIENLFRLFGASYIIKDEKTHYGPSYHKNWVLGVMINKDNQITIGYKKKRNFEAMLFNYAKDRKSGTYWPLEQLQYALGLMSYYRMVNKESIDGVIIRYSQKFGFDIEATMKKDLKN